jgi:hypothetical protein
MYAGHNIDNIIQLITDPGVKRSFGISDYHSSYGLQKIDYRMRNELESNGEISKTMPLRSATKLTLPSHNKS